MSHSNLKIGSELIAINKEIHSLFERIQELNTKTFQLEEQYKFYSIDEVIPFIKSIYPDLNVLPGNEYFIKIVFSSFSDLELELLKSLKLLLLNYSFYHDDDNFNIVNLIFNDELTFL